jgi:hypothetical protein
LAISLSGFDADDFEALTVTAFKAGWWNDELADGEAVLGDGRRHWVLFSHR